MFFNRINIRIGLWYSLAFLVSSLALFGLTAFLLNQSLQNKDKILLKEKVQEYSTLFARDGVRGLQLQISSQEIRDAQNFIVRLSDKNGKTLFIHSPDRSHDTNAPSLTDINLFLQDKDSEWIILPSKDFGDQVEIVSKRLQTGELLQIGKDAEDREEFLRSFGQAYFLGLFPVFVLAIAVGGLLSNRLLKPIRDLTQTVESIRSGDSSARVK